MRRRTRKCPLCGVWMTGKPNQPNSKHLDHILPRNQGGTHTHGNVRIICALCNLTRPKDGSDYTGPLTLWAQGEIPVSRPDRRRLPRVVNRATCRKGIHPWTPENIITLRNGTRRCRPCRIATEQRRGKCGPLQRCRCGVEFPAAGRTFMCPACIEATAKRAAELHASGLSWSEVAIKVGYGSHNGEGARYAAKRIGYVAPPRPPRSPVEQPPRPCGKCGTPKKKHSIRCDHCTMEKAQRAVQLRQAGMTLREIADQFGFASITTVTNLMREVVVIEPRIGRPPAVRTPSNA